MRDLSNVIFSLYLNKLLHEMTRFFREEKKQKQKKKLEKITK